MGHERCAQSTAHAYTMISMAAKCSEVCGCGHDSLAAISSSAASMTAAPFSIVAIRMSWPGQSTNDTCRFSSNFPFSPSNSSGVALGCERCEPSRAMVGQWQILALACPSLTVMFRSSSFLKRTVCTPEVDLTTVDFPWATWAITPSQVSGTQCENEISYGNRIFKPPSIDSRWRKMS